MVRISPQVQGNETQMGHHNIAGMPGGMPDGFIAAPVQRKWPFNVTIRRPESYDCRIATSPGGTTWAAPPMAPGSLRFPSPNRILTFQAKGYF